jgi:hypothetical protein
LPLFQKIVNRSPFLIRLFSWEYWPFSVFYIPVYFYYTWLAIKARSFFFFSASNPSIETGGMFGESKCEIYKLIPKYLYPTTIIINEGTSIAEVLKMVKEAGIVFPLIAKPDRGERGWLVAKIKSQQELISYAEKVRVNYLIQSYVHYPIELSVFYYRIPGTEKGVVTSITGKKMLSVTGNGVSTLRNLILSYPRALLQLPVLEKEDGLDLNLIPPRGEEVELVPIGNHSRGTMFIDRCDLIDEKLTDVIDSISRQIPGFFFGRYDLRCESIEKLKNGEGISILELNGAGAEPAHIYQPGFSLLKAYGVLFFHFKKLYEVSRANNKQGIRYMTLKEYLSMQQLVKQYKQKALA